MGENWRGALRSIVARDQLPMTATRSVMENKLQPSGWQIRRHQARLKMWPPPFPAERGRQPHVWMLGDQWMARRRD